MKGKGKYMLEEWSNQRSPTFTRTDGVNIPNPNHKKFQFKPVIETKDWSNAMRWDLKAHRILHVYRNKNIYCTSDVDKDIKRSDCKEYLDYINIYILEIQLCYIL